MMGGQPKKEEHVIQQNDIVRHKRNAKLVGFVESVGDDDKAQVTYFAGGMTGTVPVTSLEQLPAGERSRFAVWVPVEHAGNHVSREERHLVADMLREAGSITQLQLAEQLAERLAIDDFKKASTIVSSTLAYLCANGGARYARRMAPCCRKGKKRTRHWSRLYEHVMTVVD